MIEICNQVFVKDSVRDRKYLSTMVCKACGEESNSGLKLPCPVTDFTNELKAFIELHDAKGCNKILAE